MNGPFGRRYVIGTVLPTLERQLDKQHFTNHFELLTGVVIDDGTFLPTPSRSTTAFCGSADAKDTQRGVLHQKGQAHAISSHFVIDDRVRHGL